MEKLKIWNVEWADKSNIQKGTVSNYMKLKKTIIE